MADCNSIVEQVYNHPDLCNVISKIHPESIRDDLRQEIAVSLLEQPCDKVASLFASDNLLRYAIKTGWVMATCSTSSFYKKYRKSELKQAAEYLKHLYNGINIPLSLAYSAKMTLESKTETKEGDHEVRLFNKYIELGTARAVARHYGIPAMHVCRVIKKVKTELKQSCTQ